MENILEGDVQNTSTMRPKEKGYKRVNGIQLYYEIYGTGNPLVLIHGGGGSILNDYGKIIPLLKNNFKLIGIDLQNHGRSEQRDIPETFEQDADDIAALLAALHIKMTSFLGFSNGGSTVLQIAVRHPKIVKKLIIASAIYKREGMVPGFFDGFEHPTLDRMPKSLQKNFLRLNPDKAKLLNMFEKDSERMKNFKDFNDEMLISIAAPSLILVGDQDVVLPEHALEMKRLIPSSRLLVLPAIHGAYLMPDFDGKTNRALITETMRHIISFLEIEEP